MRLKQLYTTAIYGFDNVLQTLLSQFLSSYLSKNTYYRVGKLCFPIPIGMDFPVKLTMTKLDRALRLSRLIRTDLKSLWHNRSNIAAAGRQVPHKKLSTKYWKEKPSCDDEGNKKPLEIRISVKSCWTFRDSFLVDISMMFYFEHFISKYVCP